MNTVRPEATKLNSLALFCLTPGGVRLAQRLQPMLPQISLYSESFTSEKLAVSGFSTFDGSFAASMAQAFTRFDALVVIGATGIVVRVLAPLLQDKLQDPAVVVLDERGQHAISLLSGHLGGANRLARQIAALIEAEPVITTATDVNEVAALDMLAQKLDAQLADFRQGVKRVNQLLVSGDRVGLWIDPMFDEHVSEQDRRGFIVVDDLAALPDLTALVCISWQANLPPLTLPVFKLVPKRVVLGVGCRRDTPFATVHHLLLQQLTLLNIDPLAFRAIGSITLKQDEAALQQLAQRYAVPFHLFTPDALCEHEHRFPCSEFVRKTVGVGCVSQPAAWLLLEKYGGGKFVGETLREQGVTLTLALTLQETF
ncbi:cobalt-precorrin 5A hydrolase [Hafnia sp.]|uniref:cobalt-precorrin 5A hydrolase n=1 Tax=Hafnia sp. TaxID=1873498 RepID=UPI002FCB3B90